MQRGLRSTSEFGKTDSDCFEVLLFGQIDLGNISMIFDEIKISR